jgi:hypothetical protein
LGCRGRALWAFCKLTLMMICPDGAWMCREALAPTFRVAYKSFVWLGASRRLARRSVGAPVVHLQSHPLSLPPCFLDPQYFGCSRRSEPEFFPVGTEDSPYAEGFRSYEQ